ncbi:hypothetical protein P43SY_000168 [Pythium insidiosum]|uniref:DM2 domain-containing protein n=1 Tax=Pythium insidiosum TaxID=114742 RepID=A0AAD5Q557_PYTIN|nr:hypothetical protein P43SY_000168 [Pythium insidiosum]
MAAFAAQNFLQQSWPFASELALLERVQRMREDVDDKLLAVTRDFRAHRFYPRRTEVRPIELCVHHTVTPPVAGSEETPGTPGRWTLHLQAIDRTSGFPQVANLANYFRKISIELDPRLFSESMIEWTCFQKDHQTTVERLEVSRTGATAHSVRIKLQPSHPIERYTLSEELLRAIQSFLPPSRSYSKSDVIMGVWEYIKRKNLIKEDDCRVAVCDSTLLQLFHCESLPFASLVVALRPHLTVAAPLDLEYHVTLEADGDASKPINEKVFDVDVGCIGDVERARDAALREWEELHQEQQKELQFLQQQEAHLLDQLHALAQKHEWMTQFSTDPAGFLADLVRSQQADQQILTAEAETDEISRPHPHQFTQPWVREIVSDLLVPTQPTH